MQAATEEEIKGRKEEKERKAKTFDEFWAAVSQVSHKN